MADQNSSDAQIQANSPSADQNSLPDSPATADSAQLRTPETTPSGDGKTGDTPTTPSTPDPIEGLFEKNGDDKIHLSPGEKNFVSAVEKMAKGISSGDSDAISKFGKANPKIRDAVAKKFKIEGTPATPESLDEFLSSEYPDAAKSQKKEYSFEEKDEQIIKANLVNLFREKAESVNLKFDDLKKSPEYKTVIDSAKNTLAYLQERRLPASDFEKLFNFEREFAIATLEAQKTKAYEDGMRQQKKIINGASSSPTNNAEHVAGGNNTQSSLVSFDQFHEMSNEQKRKYREYHTRPDGTIKYLDS